MGAAREEGTGEVGRTATVAWRGGLAGGAGRLTTGSGTADGTALSWGDRTAPDGPAPAATSPEELIAAAHAGCYSMSLANVLGERRVAHGELDVSARCVAGDRAGALAIRAVHLTVRVDAPDLDDATFAQLAREAERRCPVSNLMRGNVEVLLDARRTPSA